MAGETLKLTPTESVAIRSSTPELLEVEASYGAGGKPPPRHLHPAQDEHFEVLEGAVRVRAGEEDRVLRAGEQIDIPRGTPHRMWNPEGAAARVRWQTTPGGRTESWLRDVDALQRASAGGMPGPLAFAVLLSEYGDTFRLAVGPQSVARGAIAALATLGRLRGHRAHPAEE